MSPGKRPRKGTLPPSHSTPPTATSTTPRITSIRPRSAMAAGLLEGELEGPLAGAETQMPVRRGRRAAAARRPHDEADFEEIGLDQLGQRLSVVVDRRGNRLEPDRTAAVLLDDRLEEAPVEPVQPARVDAFHGEGRV